MLLFIACQQANNNLVIRLGHGLDTNHSVHKAMLKMGEELYRISSGTTGLVIPPSNILIVYSLASINF